jgi:hypothetical protein
MNKPKTAKETVGMRSTASQTSYENRVTSSGATHPSLSLGRGGTHPYLLIVLCCSVALSTRAATYYVDIKSPTPTPPYTDWTTAATNIQDAVDYASAGDLVLVNDGTYTNGGRVVSGTLTNRVAITNAIIVQSLNGPSVTAIHGTPLSGPQGPTRCAYLASGATLSGFTLAQAFTVLAFGSGIDNQGAGAWCEDATSVITNCAFSGNGNSLYNSWGGGAYGGTLNGCILSNNSAMHGGGAYSSALNNCLVWGNSTGLTTNGGGAASSALINCTVWGNQGVGVIGCSLLNCILWQNSGKSGLSNFLSSSLNYCCVLPLPSAGTGNFTNAPQITGDYHLQSNSPCINAGKNTYAPSSLDLGGNPRIVGGTVDVGAYEFQNPKSTISYACLQQYGLKTDGTADYADPDHDGRNNWQEWICGTNPTNAQSVLRMNSAAAGAQGVTVSWQSVSNRSYSVERAGLLTVPTVFTPIASGIAGLPSATTFLDTNAAGRGPFLYRVQVEQ